MSIVIDSNVLLALAFDGERARAVEEQLELRAGEPLHAPDLIRYEIASGLTRTVAAGALTPQQAGQAWERIAALDVNLHRLDNVPGAIEIALALERRSAYDGAYLALGRSLDAEVWTFDGPLYRNAAGKGFRVRLLGGS